MSAVPAPRLFLCIELDEAAHAAVADLLSRLQKAAQFTPARFGWVAPESLHLTLYFLGPTPGESAAKLGQALERKLAQIDTFDIDIRHLGYFPRESGEPPKVLWTSVYNPPEALKAVRDLCADSLRESGLPVPDQAFHPHITLARIKSTKGLREFQRVSQTYDYVKCGRSTVTRVTLMESITGDGPAVYRPYGTFPLKNCTR
ncbi:RNA 2',3'-cyclic phosphodiesterase [bacterium]|nr:RNA 2',3'-cyclic phosphodiesterase [bacterium]